MSPLVSILLPSCVLAIAYVLARREWHSYRSSAETGDLFVYGRGRLVRRLVGVGVLAALALTLTALDILPARTPRGAHTYLGLFAAEIGTLVALALWDLWETGRTAQPGKGVTFGDPKRPPRRPPPG